MSMSDPVALARSARWQQASDRLARWAWPVLVAAVAFALLGGVGIAAWNPDTGEPEPVVDECESPPCFGGGGLPSAIDLPVVLPVIGYGLAIVLGLPSLLAGGWDLLRGRWPAGARRLLAFGGPVLLVAGTEIIPHLLSPCLPTVLGADWLPAPCERTEQGVDVEGRWHALDHALVGALPMAVLYGRVLRRWRPDILRWRSE